MAPLRQNIGVKFPSAVAWSLYEQRAETGIPLAGANTWRATGVPIGRDGGLGKIKGLGEGEGLEGVEARGLGVELATGDELEQALRKTMPAAAAVPRQHHNDPHIALLG